MKSYPEKNNLHYFTFSPNSKKAQESSNAKKGGGGEETMLSGPQRTSNNTPISHFDRRGMETQTSAIQDLKY
jgi:hypothetical protein